MEVLAHRKNFSSIYHAQVGHRAMSKCRKEKGIPPAKHATDDVCEVCWKAELKETKKPKETTHKANTILYRIHMDLTGRKPSNLQGLEYAIILVDDKSRLTWTILLANRGEWVEKVMKWKTMVEKQYPPYTVARFRTDSEPTIVGNKVWSEWLDDEGIVHERAAPHSQFQNGVAEKRVGLLGKMTKAMLFGSGLPPGDWHHAMRHATFLLNRAPSNTFPSSDGYLSPHQVFHQGGPDFVPTGVFGCQAWAKVYVKGKMDPQAAECIWLGHDEEVKGDLVRKLSNQYVGYSRVIKLHCSIMPYLNNA